MTNEGPARIINGGGGVRPVYQYASFGVPLCDQTTVDDSPAVLVLPQAEASNERSYAIIINGETGNDTVYLGTDSTVTASTGFPVIGGGSIPWPAQSAAWAISGSGDSSVVSYIDFRAPQPAA